MLRVLGLLNAFRNPRRDLAARLVHFAAAVVCVLFITSVRDLVVPQDDAWLVAQCLPPSNEADDARLDVTVVDEYDHPISAASVRVFGRAEWDRLLRGRGECQPNRPDSLREATAR